MHLLTREGYALHALPFGITLNHDVGASSLALLAAPYTYYWHAAFNLSRLHPSGGAIAGGTRLTLYLTDPTLLVDLGGEAHGIFCRFSFSQRSPTTAAALRTEVVVPGALVECGGAEVCGGGGAAIGCEAPAHPCRAACSLTAGVEATINGQDYSDSGAVYAYYDHELHAVHRAHPRGGPQGGGTQLTLRGAAFARGPGPAACRFGDGALALEAAATVINDSALNCSVPPLELSAHSCAACATADCWQPPRCRAPGAATSVLASPLSVAVEVSLDGGLTYSRSGVGYAFFDDRLVRVRALTPAGGPRRGGTRVALRADGLRDLGGLRCLFDGEVPSEIRDVSREPSCTAPPDSPAGWDAASRSVAVGVTLNGELNGASVDGAPAFTYYDPDLLRIAVMHPRGGPAAGGTVLHLSLADDALLVDLGGEAHGLLCRFDGTALRRVVVDAAGTPASELARVPVWSTASSPGGVWRSEHVEPWSVVVSASVADCAGRRECGGGGRALRCVAPEYAGGAFRDGMASLALSVSIDGQSFSVAANFTAFDADSWRPRAFAPRGGPVEGGTSVAFALPPAVAGLGDVRCRFGEYKGHVRLADATVSGAGEVRCATPPARAVGRVVPAVTLNGQQYEGTAPHAAAFEYFAVASRTPVPFPSTATEMARPLAVRRVTPSGGPSLGGTLVTVGGTGFRAGLGALTCLFGANETSQATPSETEVTFRSETEVTCASPPRTGLAAASEQAVALEVTLNGELEGAAVTADATLFTYYAPDAFVISSIYPRGGALAGGLRVTLYGVGFGDLKHGTGTFCQFGSAALAPARPATPPAGGGEALECTSPRANLSLADAPAIAPGAEGHQTSRTPDALRQARAPTPAAGAPAGTFVVPLRATRNGDVAALSNAVEFTYSPGDDADAHECAGVNEAGFS